MATRSISKTTARLGERIIALFAANRLGLYEADNNVTRDAKGKSLAVARIEDSVCCLAGDSQPHLTASGGGKSVRDNSSTADR
jgi:hypothetical protein